MIIVSNTFFQIRRVTSFFLKTLMNINVFIFFIILIFLIIKKFEKFKERIRFELKIVIYNVLFKQKKLKKH